MCSGEQEKRFLKPGDSAYIRAAWCMDATTTAERCEFLAILTPSKIEGPFSVITRKRPVVFAR